MREKYFLSVLGDLILIYYLTFLCNGAFVLIISVNDFISRNPIGMPAWMRRKYVLLILTCCGFIPLTRDIVFSVFVFDIAGCSIRIFCTSE